MRHVLITGSAGGIGQALVRKFQAEGWKVIGVDIKQGIDISALYWETEIEWPEKLDALINNAAIQYNKSLLTTTYAEWEQVMAVNLRSAWDVARSCHGLLKAAKGSIVNISSVHAFATLPNKGAYPVSKAGLVALTRSMALEWAEDGIRCNCVLPGAIDTPLLRQNAQRRAPLGRVGSPREVAEIVYFLADNEKSSFITGASFVIDGGVLSALSSEAGRECGKND